MKIASFRKKRNDDLKKLKETQTSTFSTFPVKTRGLN